MTGSSIRSFKNGNTWNNDIDGNNDDDDVDESDRLLVAALPVFDDEEISDEQNHHHHHHHRHNHHNHQSRHHGRPGHNVHSTKDKKRLSQSVQEGSTSKASESMKAKVNGVRPPRTGAEYLQMVRREAAASPAVVVATLPFPQTVPLSAASPDLSSASPSARAADSSHKHPLLEGLAPSLLAAQAPAHLRPLAAWTNSFLLTFAAWRLDFERASRKRLQLRQLPPQKHPRLENEAEWRKLCLQPPTMAFLASLNQRQTLRLIDYHTRWLDSKGLSSVQAQWLFALLVKIDKLLTGDAIDTLRSLCRRCLQLRADITQEVIADEEPPDTLASLNIVIVIVAKYFQQHDLFDGVM